MLKGSINHLSLTVSDLPKAMGFFAPFPGFLGYVDVPSLRFST